MLLKDVKAGDKIVCDHGFTKLLCTVHGRTYTVCEDSNGLYILCEQGKHYLDTDEDDIPFKPDGG